MKSILLYAESDDIVWTEEVCMRVCVCVCVCVHVLTTRVYVTLVCVWTEEVCVYE